MHSPCAVVPVYNHESAITTVVDALIASNLPCILVDDASSPRCARVLDRLAQREICLLYTSPSPRDGLLSRMPSSA